MTSYEEALALLLDAVGTLPEVDCDVAHAGGRHLADRVCSGVDLPPFDNSSMDGYAVRSGDLAGGKPVTLRMAGEVGAGCSDPIPVESGTCVRVFTGAPLPPGADSVVMQEDTRVSADGLVTVLDPVRPWENVRFRGEDVRSGGLLLEAGSRLGPGQIALLLASGIRRVRIRRPAAVAIASTGDELVQPGEPLGPGKVFDCNAAALAELLRAEAGSVTRLPVIPDEPAAAERALEAALRTADVVVTAGGASVGGRDCLRPAFERIGGVVRFWRIAIRPGKPFFFGERDGRFVFGLPGNPVSALVTASLLVVPALRRLQGARQPGPAFLPARLAEAVSNPGDRRHFLRIRREPDGSVRSSGVQASHILGSLAHADGLADIPAGAELHSGDTVPVLFW